ncbi:hypothetical protein WA158_003096 [Blastocystis sp. Blastoise]
MADEQVNNPVELEVESNWDKEVNSFDELHLNDDLLRGIYAYGFEKPSAIQQKAILPILEGRDTIAQAQSGTGKTATFSIAMLQKINPKENSTNLQINEALSEYMEVTMHCCVGGTAIAEDVAKLSQGVQIVIGTPGRVNDMVSRGAFDLSHCILFCLDEADEMLSRGFKEQIYEVFRNFNSNIQLLFSLLLCLLMS